MRRPDEGLILQPVRVFARPRPKADIICFAGLLRGFERLFGEGILCGVLCQA